MGVSDVTFKGVEFSAPDSALEIWLKLMSDAIDELPDAPDWLRELRDDWYLQATEHFGFGIVPNLDQHLVDEARRRTLLDVSRQAMARLDALGDPLTAQALNSIGVSSEGSPFTQDDVRGVVRDTAKTFVALVSGDPVHHIS